MTATEVLRRMLDERGMEWTDGGMFHRTHWVIDGIHYVAFEQSGKLYLQSSMGPLTPAQAIAATLGNEGVARSNDGVAELGAGTCHETMIDRFFRGCSECGYMWEYMYGIGRCQRPNYCPNCGRKVVDDG